MKILLVFSLYLISAAGGSRRVTGFSGGGVLIKCRYEKQYTSNTKSFCRSSVPNCAVHIKTEGKTEWVNSGRFSLVDNTSAAFFSVMITNLTVEDSGEYQCVVHISRSVLNAKAVELNVEEDQDGGTRTSECYHVGGGLNISCKYPKPISGYPKFFCRVFSGGCVYKTLVTESRKWINQGNHSLYVDISKNIFTVRIDSLTQADSGEYWCGAESDWKSDNGYKLYITHIRLTVTESGVSSVTSTTAMESSASKTTPASSSATCQRDISHITNSQHSETTTIFPATPSSTVISIVSVILVLLLTAILLFIIAIRKRKTTQASSTIQSDKSSTNHQMVPLAEVEYEEIKDPTLLPHNDSDTVYFTAELPSSLPDSGEGLTYSTMNFSSTDSTTITTASVGKKQDSCDYATVRDVT
ncbi:CMRF35-like molecule 8 isoform X2 [Hoplias malabaricus]|uniref:CMRF35-like molecule 8 isoform X2 n=1 Tax=Hoplias malabaricus TaxID=27720 RepID=UPI0034637AFF